MFLVCVWTMAMTEQAITSESLDRQVKDEWPPPEARTVLSKSPSSEGLRGEVAIGDAGTAVSKEPGTTIGSRNSPPSPRKLIVGPWIAGRSGYLGLSAAALSKEAAALLATDGGPCLVVYWVEPGSVADLAGIRAGDRILEIDGVRAVTAEGLPATLEMDDSEGLQLRVEFGFSTQGSRDPHQNSHSRDGRRETQMVTGDLNAALVEWVVQYRISDPAKYLFEVRKPSETLRFVSESVMREVVGDRTVDEVITIGRQEIEAEALTKMQALSTKYAMGISIDQVQLKNINPPKPVQESFNEVNQAQQEKEKLINEARRDYNKVIPLAKGEKDQRIREADGYRLKRINEAQGDIARFTSLLAEYRKAPEVTRRRIYVETLQDVMPRIRSKIVVDEGTRSILPLLNLDTRKGDQK